MEPAPHLDIQDILRIQDPVEFTIRLSDLVCGRAYSLGIDALSPAERVVFLVDEAQREIGNGGMRQFFDNLVGGHAAEVPAALHAIGAHGLADAVAEAVQLFGASGPSRDQVTRWAQVEALDARTHERLDTLTRRYEACPEPVTNLVRAYVERHRGQFEPPLA